jgi:hypothetical protein
MKSRSRCFILLGLVMNSGCATGQPVKVVDRLDASLGSVTASRSAVGPKRAPIGFARGASVDTRGARKIQGYPVSRVATATSSVDEFQPGVLGGLIGAAVGGALGFVWARAQWDNGVEGPLARPVLTGAAVGAALGLFVEWVVRSGPTPAPPR